MDGVPGFEGRRGYEDRHRGVFGLRPQRHSMASRKTRKSAGPLRNLRLGICRRHPHGGFCKLQHPDAQRRRRRQDKQRGDGVAKILHPQSRVRLLHLPLAYLHGLHPDQVSRLQPLRLRAGRGVLRTQSHHMEPNALRRGVRGQLQVQRLPSQRPRRSRLGRRADRPLRLCLLLPGQVEPGLQRIGVGHAGYKQLPLQHGLFHFQYPPHVRGHPAKREPVLQRQVLSSHF